MTSPDEMIRVSVRVTLSVRYTLPPGKAVVPSHALKVIGSSLPQATDISWLWVSAAVTALNVAVTVTSVAGIVNLLSVTVISLLSASLTVRVSSS